MIAELLLGASVLVATPDAPRPKVTKTEMTMLSADLVVRELDTFSTQRMLARGNHEKFLPDVISHHTPVMAAYGAAVVASNYLAVRYLEKHHHHRLAMLVPMVDIAQDAPMAVHNLYLK